MPILQPLHETATPVPRRRVILLGASNVTLGFPLLVKSLRQSLAGVDLYAAHGHGRSYCDWSYVLHRGLPSILDCGLWDALSSSPSAERSWALVTDVGNDLIYGIPPECLMKNMEQIFSRLQSLGAAITFVRLPLERARLLTDRNYRIIKQLLFPGPTVPWIQMQQWMMDVDEQATALAISHGAAVVQPELGWYGIDPIHIRYSQRPAAWRTMLSTWPFEEEARVSRPEFDLVLRAWSQAPAERSYWRRLQHRAQPTWKIANEMTLWLY
jgi:hypothetical protein